MSRQVDNRDESELQGLRSQVAGPQIEVITVLRPGALPDCWVDAANVRQARCRGRGGGLVGGYRQHKPSHERQSLHAKRERLSGQSCTKPIPGR